MIRVRLLGTIALESSDGRELRSVLAQPKRFALLAYLAARPRALHRRDTLLATFWPDADDTHARWALSQALRFLRKELGGPSNAVVQSRGADEITMPEHAGKSAPPKNNMVQRKIAIVTVSWANVTGMEARQLKRPTTIHSRSALGS